MVIGDWWFCHFGSSFVVVVYNVPIKLPYVVSYNSIIVHGIVSKICIILTFISIYDYMMSCSLLTFGEELGHWVKSQSTTWFSNFLLIKYDNKSWNEQFQMPKNTFIDICIHATPMISN